MEKPAKPKENENENYWGYIIFAALILIYIPFGNTIWGDSVNSTVRTNNRTYQSTAIDKKESESKEKIYTCSICGRETGKHADQMWKGKCYMCYEATKKKR